MTTSAAPTPRLALPEPPYEPALQALLERLNPPGAPTLLALFRLLALHPPLAERLRGWGGFLLGPGAALPLRDRELVIDRVCARCGAEYEWGVHVAAFAGAAGFSAAEVAAISAVPAGLAALGERERLLVRLVDELHEGCDVGDALWAELAAVWSPAQLIELLLLAGWYRAIAGLCRSTRLPLESWAARFATVA